MFVTTSYRPTGRELTEAQELAERLRIPIIDRRQDSLAQCFQRTGMSEGIIVAKNGWRYEHQGGNSFSFHPNMSALRLKQLQQGKQDLLVTASRMQSGDHVLDCTLGMGADAIVASFIVGEQGKVVGLESQPVIASFVKRGLQTYLTDRKELSQAMKRIDVIKADYRYYLKACADQSFDIVLFDPMFRQTIQASTAMQQLKQLANPYPLDMESLREAKRIARKTVLFKERTGSAEFHRLGMKPVTSSSNYTWGVYNLESPERFDQ